ncbi:MAG: hypothetical protein JSW10_04205, partial [Pseudomonadota bacterium]
CMTSGAATVLCTSCGADPVRGVNITSLSPGPHMMVACANDALGCTASAVFEFTIEPEDLAIQCADDFTVTLNPGETEVAAVDPRIADNLSAQVVGNCGIEPVITHYPPDVFAVGDTVVEFSAIGVGNCTTTVTVDAAPSRHIAILDKVADGLGMLRVHEAYSGTEIFGYPLTGVTTPSVQFAYSADGALLGLAYNNVFMTLDADTGVVNAGSEIAVSGDLARGRIAFHPNDSTRYAIQTETSSGQFKVRLYNSTVEVDAVDVPAVTNMSGPELTWSRGGSKLTAAYTVPTVGVTGAEQAKYRVFVHKWDVSASGFGSLSSLSAEKEYTPREEIHELFAVDGDVFVVTTRGVSTVNGAVPWLTHLGNIFMDVTSSGKYGLLIRKIPDHYKLILANNPTSTTSMLIVEGPSIAEAVLAGKPRPVAIAPDGRMAALVVQDNVLIYRLPDFVSSVNIGVQRVFGMEFRPMPP